MVDLSAASTALPAIGKAIGWKLDIAGQTIDHASAWASITVSMDSGIAPGSVTLEIRGLSTEQFAAIASARLPANPAGGVTQVLFATLHLYWRDRQSLEGSNPPPSLIFFAVTALSRQSEGLQFVTRIEGRDAIYEVLTRARTPAATTPISASGPLEAARRLLETAGLVAGGDFVVHDPPAGSATGSDATIVIQSQAPVLPQLNQLEDVMLQRFGRRGRGVYLLNRGKLHVGPFRPMPISGAVKSLDDTTGFITATRQASDEPVAPTEAVSGDALAVPPRAVWRVEMVGRTDIGPGDMVSFIMPGEDAALFSGFGLQAVAGARIAPVQVTVYVSSVHHVMGRNRGWTMTLAGVEITGEPVAENAWDIVTATTGAVPVRGEPAPRADPAASVRGRVETIAANEAAARRVLDVGEVRAAKTATRMDGENVSVAAHSSNLLVGAEVGTGAGAARLSDLLRNGSAADTLNTPYVTPFAWGPFGLVLPRYPGTRVMVSYHRGSVHDPVDMGALWRTSDDAETSAPTNTEPGDWWLILPAGLSEQAASSADGTGPVAVPANAKASHDLIDASGERFIEVKGFTIRSYGENSLTRPKDRPRQPKGENMRGGIQIVHVDSGAMIAIATDGKITIKATGELVLEGEGIKLKPGRGTVDVG